MLKGFEPRLYQQTILNTCTEKNTLVVLPTGLGKTGVGMLTAASRLKKMPKSKIVFLAPTKPLVQQHLKTFKKHFDISEDKMQLFTGEISANKRSDLWENSQLIFSTPQGFENDIITNKISLENVSLMIFDESHRAVGDYAYVFIAEKYVNNSKNPLVLGLTASPGDQTEKIKEVCNNLFIQEIELRTETDPDVEPYVQEIDIEQIEVKLPAEFKEIKIYLQKCFKSKLVQIKNYGYLPGEFKYYGRAQLLQMQRGMHAKMAQGQKDFQMLKSISLLAEAMKIQHALILLETQGLESLVSYLERLQEQAKTSKVKAVQNLVQDTNFKSALMKAESLIDKNIEHPKLQALKKIVAKTLNKQKDAKIIIFNQYRDQIVKVKQVLDDLGVTSEVFVGQAKKSGTGMSQKEQKEVIQRFEEGEFNCILATSVAEEGLDIPVVDLVVFYEPVPSAIRTVQRRGRTGRQEKGNVVVLITKDTIDEGYKWSAHHKEKRMVTAIQKLKKDFRPELKEQKISDFVDEKITIYADYREKGAGVIKELSLEGVDVQLIGLKVGDYLLSEDLCVEFKKVPDFVDSIIDGRLLEQIKNLKQYKKSLVVLEGEEDIFAQRKIHPNAVRGMMATIMINYGIPIFQTKDSTDTAQFLKLLAKREQEGKGSEFQFHTSKPMSLKDRQEYIVAALPGIGNKLAKPLLEEFGSVKNIVNASEDKLKKVDLIGSKKAKDIREILDKEYEK